MNRRDVIALRGRLGMSQAELANHLGLRHRSQVSRLETEARPIHGAVLVLLQRLKARTQKPAPRTPGEPLSGLEAARARRELGLTQERLAALLRCPSGGALISMIEQGRARYTGAKLALLNDLLEEHRSGRQVPRAS